MRSNCTCSVRKASRTMGGVVWGDRSERSLVRAGPNVREDRKRIQLAQLVLVAHPRVEQLGYQCRRGADGEPREQSQSDQNGCAGLDRGARRGGRWVREKAGSPDLWIARRRSSRSASSPAASPVPGSVRRFEGSRGLTTNGHCACVERRLKALATRAESSGSEVVAVIARTLLSPCGSTSIALETCSVSIRARACGRPARRPRASPRGSPPSGRCASSRSGPRAGHPIPRARDRRVAAATQAPVRWPRTPLADDDPGDARRQGRQDHRNDEGLGAP